MCEQTLEAAGMTREEITAVPKRRTWFGYVGGRDEYLTPKLCASREIAEAQCTIRNAEMTSLGPWSVVTLFESLRVPQ